MNLETAYLGAITLRLLHDLPTDVSGWLIHALAVWIIDGRQPDECDIPTEALGAWIAIREESTTIHDARKERSAARSEAGKIGNAKRWNRNASQDVAEDRNASQDIASRAPAKTKTKTKIYTDVSADADTSVRACELRPAVSTDLLSSAESADDHLKETSYDVWARSQKDPVDVALDATGEPPAKRRVYGARLKLLGRDRFLDTVCTFRAEVEADETVRNLGAALTKRLNDAIEAKEACAG